MEPEIELVGVENTPEAPSETAVDITNPQYVNLPKQVVEERAQKANLALGENSPGVDSLRAAIERGDESYARETTANELRLKERDNRMTMLRELAGSRPAGSPITQDEVDLAAGLTIEPVVDPRTVWEKQYGNYLTNRLVMQTDDPDGSVNAALRENPANTYANLDVARDLITKNERVNNRLAEMEARRKEMGWGEYLWDLAETVIPGRSSLNITNTPFFSRQAFGAIALSGSTVREQIEDLLATPSPEVFAEKLDQAVDRIAETNISDAIEFLNAVKSYSVSEQFMKNIFGLLDAADITAVAGLIAKGTLKAGARIGSKTLTKAEAESIKAVDDTLKATTGPQVPSQVAGKIGDTDTSAALKVVARHAGETASDIPNGNVQDRFRALTEPMPTFSRPGDIFDGSASLGNAQSTRLTAMLEHNAAKFLDTVSTTITPERLTPEALSRAIRNARIEIKKDFEHLSSSVLDVVRNQREAGSSVDSVSIRLGRPDATTFASSNEANLYARDIYNLPPGAYSVEQQGTAHFIDVRKPIRETAEDVNEVMVTTNNQTPIPNVVTAALQGYRTPAEISSALTKSNRDAALLGTTNFTNFLSEVAAPIGRLSNNQRRDLQRVMELNRDHIDEVGNRGRYYDTVEDLETAYQQNFKRLPTEEEVGAYYTAVQINEMDWMIRNFVAYRDLSRRGIEEFRVKVGYEGYSEYSAPKYIETQPFKAKEVDHIPWSDPKMLPVALVDEGGTGPKLFYRGSSDDDRNFLEGLLTEGGYKIIQVARPQDRVLRETLGITDPVQYIVTKGHTKSPLSFHQVDRQPGFHVQYADNYFLKQPRVSNLYGGGRAYEGDATLWSFQTRAQAKKFEQRVNELRVALRNGVEDLTPYISGKLPENEAWWRRQFSDDDGFFDLNQPFRVTERNSNTRDSDPLLKELRDLTDGDTTLTADIDRKFQGDRSQNLLTPVEGTEENPLIRLKTAPLIDPLSTTSRGIGQAIRSKYFGDMKLSTAQQFVREFGDLIDAAPSDLLERPMYFLHNPVWRNGADPQRLAAAQAIQKTTMEFVGRQSPFGQTFQNIQDKLMDSIYGIKGQGAAEKLRTAQDFINSRDPLSYFRAWAFRAKMGFLNVQQVFVQSQGLAHITAIAPQHAAQSMAAYSFTRAMMLNDSPEIVKGAAQKLKHLGWKPEHFEESYALMKRTGWHNVGREATFIDDMSDPKLYEGQVGKWLDKSAIFFTETERMVRITGWHAAYREWRAANPNKTVTNRDMGEILSRADTMTMNMTNASKASWERGILSIPAQFQSYSVRIFEQMWGGQLSAAEKARVIGLNSALYGIPVGVSAPLAYPLYEDVRAWALENGYTVNNEYIDGMIKGIPAIIGAMLGHDVNYGQRYGPGGFSMIKDLKDGDKTWAETMLGPSGSVFKDIAFGAAPAGAVMVAKMLTGERFEPEVADLLDAARTITSVNAVDRVYMAMTIGKYISRKGTVLNDETSQEAIFHAVTGLSSTAFSDAMIMNQSIKDVEKRKRTFRQEITKYVSRALRETDDSVREAYMTKARAYVDLGDFTPQEKTSILQSIVGGKDRTLMDRIKRDWIMKAPASKRLDRIKNMENNQ